jgi:hypothetical protein
MVLFGSPASPASPGGRVYLSHIPVFHAPHDVQLILEVTMPSAAGLPRTFSDRMYTFLPETLSLDALRTGSLKSMSGTVYLGSFENGGRPLAKVRVDVARVVHQHVLDARDRAAAKSFFLLGGGSEAFAVHAIGGAPGFDQIVRVDVGGASAADLAKGVLVEAPAASPIESSVELRTPAGATVTVKPAKELSCLVGPDFVDPC